MRILVPTHFPLLGSGSGVYVQNLAREIVRAGHQAHVIAADHQPISGLDFPCTTITFRAHGQQSTDLPYNFPCFTTHPRSRNTFYQLTPPEIEAYVSAFRCATARTVAAFQPDLIHAQHLWVAAFCASETALPYVVTSHGTDLIGLKRDPRFRDMVERGTRGATRIIAISKQVAADITALLGARSDRIALIGNGFDPRVFHPSDANRADVLRRTGITDNPRYVVTFVGKLTQFKGADVLLRAAAIYERRLDSIATLIIGDGALRDSLEALAAELGLTGVHFLGHCPQLEVARLLAAAHVHAVPSRGEPFGIAAIEALACGTPVVGTNAGGLPDFITDDLGALVPVDDPPALAAAIEAELRAESKKVKGVAAARYALGDFTWERQVARILRLYEEVLCTP